jgi:hypothetical protein
MTVNLATNPFRRRAPPLSTKASHKSLLLCTIDAPVLVGCVLAVEAASQAWPIMGGWIAPRNSVRSRVVVGDKRSSANSPLRNNLEVRTITHHHDLMIFAEGSGDEE